MAVKLILVSLCLFVMGEGRILYSPHKPTAMTKYGEIMGTIMTSRNGRSFLAFRGIPYAEPPVGKLRFKPPKELESWTGVFDATKNGPICIQQNFLFSKEPQIEGSEDCLYVNVYTPAIIGNENKNEEDLLPVMVAIHYGAFMAGSSSSDLLGPEYLMDKDVVMVTFNYRLGIFGFLSTYDDAAPGNWAFKDQVAALKWVQDNIRAFGGNPAKVTLFGASAGAGSIHHHILSPQSKGLFHAAITQSGAALGLWAQPQRELSLAVAKIQADVVGCNSTLTTAEIVDCLREISAEDLIESMNLFRFMRSEPLTVYLPAIEVKTENNPEPFITEDPIEIIQRGGFSNVPWIIGVTSSEGILRAAPFTRQTDLLEIINADFNSNMVEMLSLRQSVTEDDLPSTWAKIKEFFFLNDEKIDISNQESVQGLINIYSDRAFLYPAYQSSLLHRHKGHDSIWFYYFDYRGNQSFGEVFAATENQIDFDWGVSHCDDLLYLFKSPQLFSNFELANSDREMSDLIIDLFSNFATYLDPTPPELFEENRRWKPLESTENKEVIENSDLRYLKISGQYTIGNDNVIQTTLVNEFHPDRMSFWINLPLKENIENLT